MADLNALYASEYDSATSYAAGDRCVYEKEWYECKTATTGAFDADKWEKKYLVDYLNSNLGGVVKSFTSSTSVSTKVTLGHKPNKLIIWGIVNLEYQLVYRYDASVSTTQYNRYITDGSIDIETLPNSDKNRISSIDNDGFTFSSVNQSGTLYYMEV